jgi:hypothetical protein
MRTNASAGHWPAEAHGSAATRRVRNAWFADAAGAIEILARREVAAAPAPDRRMNACCTRPSDDEAPTPTDRDRDDPAAEAFRQSSRTSTQDPSGQGSLAWASVLSPDIARMTYRAEQGGSLGQNALPC